MKKMKQNETRAGATWNKLGIRHAQSLSILKVAMVIIAARADPVKKNALNSEPKRARSLGWASSDHQLILL